MSNAWPDGYDRILLDETDSTMAEARRRAPDLSQPTWILAHRQTQAHGRRGRTWLQPAGNLAATLVLKPGGTAAEAALRSFVAALALNDALAEYVDASRLSLKWPNDVLLDGGKVAGILLEAQGSQGKPDWLAIGLGVNLVAAPPADGVEPGAVAPVALNEAVTPVAFLSSLAFAYAAWETTYRMQGFSPIRAAWLDRAARLGDAITARLPKEELHGVFETVDESGQLVLRMATGRRVIAAGDVFF